MSTPASPSPGLLRRVLTAFRLGDGAADAVDYADWIQQRVRDRRELYPLPPSLQRPTIDLLTLVYNTDPELLRCTAESVQAQDYDLYRWIIWDNGTTRSDTRDVLSQLSRTPNIVVHRSEDNLGITAGHAEALTRCRGEYVALLDHDDRLYPDALRVAAFYLVVGGRPAFLYSDEDKLDATGRPFSPYFKPDWSPGFLLSTGYTCHLAVFRRELALQLGAFTDRTVEGAQDWDLALRFRDAAHPALHIPEILYSWRVLPSSTAGHGAAAKPYVIDGQRSCLEASLRRRGMYEKFRIRPNPLFGGLEGHWQLERCNEELPATDVVLIQPSLKAALRLLDEDEELRTCQGGKWVIHPSPALRPDGRRFWQIQGLGWNGFTLAEDVPAESLAAARNLCLQASAGRYLACVPTGVTRLAAGWLREGIAQLELNRRAVLVGGRMLDPAGRLVAGPTVLGLDGVAGTPNRGGPGDAVGEFGLALDPHNVAAVQHVPWVGRRAVLARFAFDADRYPRTGHEIDLCLRLLADGWQILYDPHLAGHGRDGASEPVPSKEEVLGLLQRHGELMGDDPYYSPFLSLEPERAYQLASALERRRAVAEGQRRLIGTAPALSDGPYDLSRRMRPRRPTPPPTAAGRKKAARPPIPQRSLP